MRFCGRLAGALLLAAAGCRQDDPGPAALRLTTEQFRSLAWLEGGWRGRDSALVFYERYRLLDDSTLRGYSYADSAMAAPTDSGLIEMRGGRVETGTDQARWVVTAISGDSVRFDPVHGATNSFTWRRDGPDAWNAVLVFRDSAGGTRVKSYRMERWPPR